MRKIRSNRKVSPQRVLRQSRIAQAVNQTLRAPHPARQPLAGVALALALGQQAALAATINVDGATCTLINAITAANTDTATGGCPAGSGVDTLVLPADSTITLTTVDNTTHPPGTGLPVVSSAITIEGNGATIERSSADSTPDFRILAANATGDLSLNNATISGGTNDDHNWGSGVLNDGGSVTITNSTISGNGGHYTYGVVLNGGDMTITNSTISDHFSTFGEGGVLNDGDMTITNSTIGGNSSFFSNAGVNNGGILTIADSTISGNGSGGGLYFGGFTGVVNGGDMTVTNSTISGNGGGHGNGGGVLNGGDMTITNSTISGNGAGGFIYSGASRYLAGVNNKLGTLTITNSTISGNNGGYGASAGVRNDRGSLTITNSTISGNSSIRRYDEYFGGDGGVLNSGDMTITNSTISGNGAGGDAYLQGSRLGIAGVGNTGTLTITSSTIAVNNSNSTFGIGGVHNDSGSLTLSRTIISGNAAPYANSAEIHAASGSTITADDNNLFSDASKTNAEAFVGFTPGVTDITATSDGTDPTALSNILNTSLANNGGPTKTHALVAGSPAIDAGGLECVATDQRGIIRPQGVACDIGAYEAEPSAAFVQPMVQCPGDVNDDGIADIAVVTPDGNTRIKGLTGGLVSQFTLSDINAVVDVEMMVDINANGSPELVALGTGSVQAEVWDTLTAAQLSLIPFDPALTPLDLELVTDQTGNSIPELANLGQGSVQVEVKDALTAGIINNVSFSNYVNPMDLEIYPDLNGNGSPELAVLGDNKDPAKGDKIEIRDLATGNTVQDIWMGKGWQVLQQKLIADLNGNGSEEVAVLRVKNTEDAVNVLLRDTKTRQGLGSIGFDRNYPPTHLLTLADVNGNGADEVVVFGQRFNGGNQKAQVKDSKTKALIRAVFFDKNFAGQDMATCADINGNGAEELVLLGQRASDGKLKATVKDAKTGELIGVVKF